MGTGEMRDMHSPTKAAARPTALVVEDDPSAGEIASTMLSLLGYEPRLAVDAQAALRSLSTDPPDLLMLDVCLPDLDGPKVLRIARRLQGTADVPAIAASAIVVRGAPEVEELRALGVNEFLSKPFNLPALRRALSRAHPAGPCGSTGAAQKLALPASLQWEQGKAAVTIFGVRPLTVRFETTARGLHVGQEAQIKLERSWEEYGETQQVPVRVFGNVQAVRPTDNGSRAELRVQVAVPREHWLGLCDDCVDSD